VRADFVDEGAASCAPTKEGETQLTLGEVGEGGGFGFEGGDGFEKAGDGEGIVDTAGSADQPQRAPFARKLNGNANQCGKAGAVNLRSAIEDDDNLVRTRLYEGLQDVVEMFAGFADGQPAMNVHNGDSAGFAGVDLCGRVFAHETGSACSFVGAMESRAGRALYAGSRKLQGKASVEFMATGWTRGKSRHQKNQSAR